MACSWIENTDVNVVRRVLREDFEESDVRKAARLWMNVWPENFKSGFEEGVKECENNIKRSDSLYAQKGVAHIVDQGDAIVGIAMSFLRTIEFTDHGCKATVLGLAGVCSDPSQRGIGLGKVIVQDAFSRLSEESGVDICLYQTGVPGFYEKLGARLVGNTFVDSTSDVASGESPWWDDWVMVFGREDRWLDGRVDLMGKAY